MGLPNPADRPGAAKTEWQVVILLALGFGLVGTDRFMISTMFPVIAKDLKLDYSDIGIIAGALSIAWGIAALLMGNKADRGGRKAVVVWSMVAFSLLIATHGLATGLVGLVLARIMMGLADGAYTPACVAITIDCAEPRHFGRASGLQQCTAAFFGLGIAPLIVAALLEVIDWRWVFPMMTIPGLLLAWLLSRALPEKTVESAPVHKSRMEGWRTVIAQRNIKLATGLMLCCLTCLITTSAFLPSYMIEQSGMSMGQMGVVMSGSGIGSGLGTFILLSASDRLGRKYVTLLACLAGATGLTLFLLAGSNPVAMFILLFIINFATSAVISLVVGPIAAEAVPASLMATASGIIIFVGEVIGGGLLPIAAGYLIEHYGIERFLLLPIITMLIGAMLSGFLREPQSKMADQFG